MKPKLSSASALALSRLAMVRSLFFNYPQIIQSPDPSYALTKVPVSILGRRSSEIWGEVLAKGKVSDKDIWFGSQTCCRRKHFLVRTRDWLTDYLRIYTVTKASENIFVYTKQGK
jgi:hypothetical protein